MSTWIGFLSKDLITRSIRSQHKFFPIYYRNIKSFTKQAWQTVRRFVNLVRYIIRRWDHRCLRPFTRVSIYHSWRSGIDEWRKRAVFRVLQAAYDLLITRLCRKESILYLNWWYDINENVIRLHLFFNTRRVRNCLDKEERTCRKTT